MALEFVVEEKSDDSVLDGGDDADVYNEEAAAFSRQLVKEEYDRYDAAKDLSNKCSSVSFRPQLP